MPMEWKSWFEIGHLRIDFEHRIFFDLIQNIEKAAAQGASREKLAATLTELRKYADFHFFSEENIMAEVGYPGLQAHRGLHAELLLELDRNVEVVLDEDTNPQPLVTFLYDWFASHTVNEDGRIAKFINREE